MAIEPGSNPQALPPKRNTTPLLAPTAKALPITKAFMIAKRIQQTSLWANFIQRVHKNSSVAESYHVSLKSIAKSQG